MRPLGPRPRLLRRTTTVRMQRRADRRRGAAVLGNAVVLAIVGSWSAVGLTLETGLAGVGGLVAGLVVQPWLRTKSRRVSALMGLVVLCAVVALGPQDAPLVVGPSPVPETAQLAREVFGDQGTAVPPAGALDALRLPAGSLGSASATLALALALGAAWGAARARPRRPAEGLAWMAVAALVLALLQDRAQGWRGWTVLVPAGAAATELRDADGSIRSLPLALSALGLSGPQRPLVVARLAQPPGAEPVGTARPAEQGAELVLYPGPGETRVRVEALGSGRAELSRVRGGGPPALELGWTGDGGARYHTWALWNGSAVVDPAGRFRLRLASPDTADRAAGTSGPRLLTRCGDTTREIPAEPGQVTEHCGARIEVTGFTPALDPGGPRPAPAPPLRPAVEVRVSIADQSSQGWITADVAPPPFPAPGGQLSIVLAADAWDLPGPGVAWTLVRQPDGSLAMAPPPGTAEVGNRPVEVPGRLQVAEGVEIELLQWLGAGSRPQREVRPASNAGPTVDLGVAAAEGDRLVRLLLDDPLVESYVDGVSLSLASGLPPDLEGVEAELLLQGPGEDPLVRGTATRDQPLEGHGLRVRPVALGASGLAVSVEQRSGRVPLSLAGMLALGALAVGGLGRLRRDA